MTRTTDRHMMNKPYIKSVLNELQNMGYPVEQAKTILVRHYKGVRRNWGFEPNPGDFAREIEEIHKAVNLKYNPDDPNHIYIGDLRNKLKKISQGQVHRRYTRNYRPIARISKRAKVTIESRSD